MRYGCIALFLLISSAVTASAQEVRDLPTMRTIDVSTGFTRLGTRVSPDQVVARLMTFDGNGDGKVAAAELSERMQVLVTRGDTSGDGALDDPEIRALSARQLNLGASAQRAIQYGFGDTSGSLSTRTHIHNTIDDLRLAPQTSEEAWRIAGLFIDQLENTARMRLRTGMAGMLTEGQLDEFDRNAFSQIAGGRAIVITSPDGASMRMLASIEARLLVGRYKLTADQLKTATALIETFRADLKLDEARRTALGAELADVLTAEESNNFTAALARRPVVQTAGIVGGVVGGFTIDARQFRSEPVINPPVSR
jgi:hypothetical protein